MSRNYLSKNDELFKGDHLLSNNREWKAVFQDDGNFVVYGWKPVWASHSNGSDVFRLAMQGDCNLVVYNRANQPTWATDTYVPGDHLSHLTLTDDGKLVLTKDSEVLWTSDKNCGTRH